MNPFHRLDLVGEARSRFERVDALLQLVLRKLDAMAEGLCAECRKIRVGSSQLCVKCKASREVRSALLAQLEGPQSRQDR